MYTNTWQELPIAANFSFLIYRQYYDFWKMYLNVWHTFAQP
jgi:hypothetical protein